MSPHRIRVLYGPIDPIDREDFFETICRFVASGIPHQIATVNPEFLIEATKNPAFRNALQSSALNVADGIGVRLAATFDSLPKPAWLPARVIATLIQGFSVGIMLLSGSKRLEHPVPTTIAGSDLVHEFSQVAVANGWRVYLLAGPDPLAKDAAAVLSHLHPGLMIVGAEYGINPEDSLDGQTAHELVERIRRAKPDILYVGFGAPRQELFIATHATQLGVPVMMGVGGAFDFLTQRVQRAPDWIRQLGFEWLWRLVLQPWRWRRIWRATIQFPMTVAWTQLKANSSR